VEALPFGRQPPCDGVAHVGLVERLHELDGHLARVAGERDEDAADAFDVEPGLGERLEAESVAPDAQRRVNGVPDNRDVTDPLECGWSSFRTKRMSGSSKGAGGATGGSGDVVADRHSRG